MSISSPERGKSVPLDAILPAVANEQRRAVVRVLSHTEGEVMEVSALTDQVAQHVGNRGPPTDDHRQRIRTTLHHTHLPKLEVFGLIDYNTESKQVRTVNGELGRELLAVVESVEARE